MKLALGKIHIAILISVRSGPPIRILEQPVFGGHVCTLVFSLLKWVDPVTTVAWPMCGLLLSLLTKV